MSICKVLVLINTDQRKLSNKYATLYTICFQIFFHEPIWTTFSVLNSVWNLLAIPNVNRYAITKLEHMSLILVSKMCCLSLYLNYLILNDIAKGNFWYKLEFTCTTHVTNPLSSLGSVPGSHCKSPWQPLMLHFYHTLCTLAPPMKSKIQF